MSTVHEDSGRTLSDSEREVWRSFVNGGWALLAAVNAQLSTRGVTQADFRVLEVLADSRERSISELSDTVHIRVSTMSRQVGRLVDDGSLERVENHADGRQRFVRITDHGLEVFAGYARIRDDLICRLVIDPLTPEEFRTLGEAFRKISDRIADSAIESAD
ncbi:MarR family winged helix-turn-helix transcriptional regulator [Gordonia rhizosphera]|nr:MarR family transcriptional regulator [Gordonia rhizosphera]